MILFLYNLRIFCYLFEPIQSGSLITSINIPYYIPEGITYYPNKDIIILSSLSTGVIRLLPNTDNIQETNVNNSILLYPGKYNNIFTPIVGIKVFDDYLYGAVGSLPPLEGPFYGGLLIINLNNPNDVNLVDFSSQYNGLPMTPNDIAKSDYANAIFVTDFYSYRIFRYDITTQVVSTILSNGVLCSICSTFLSYDGPNGIVTKDNYLLVARSGTKSTGSTPAIIKVPIDNPSLASIIPISPSDIATESILDGADGLVFDANNEIIYLTSNGKGIIVAIRSTYGTTVEWTTGQVVSTYNARCKYNDPSSSTIVPSTGDLIVICTELFGSGPYTINRLAGIANNYNAVENFCYDLNFPYLIPESLTYQPSTDSILYTSFGFGNIYSTFNPSISLVFGYSILSNTIKKVIDINVLSSGLLGIQVDKKYDNLIWGAFTNATRASAGIYRADTNTGKYNVLFLDTVPSNEKYTSFYNDVSIDNYDGTTYATNMRTPHKIIAAKPSNRLDIFSSISISTISSNLCLNCSDTCDGTGDCGPNGIAVIQNGNKKATTLITGVFSFNPASNGFFRIDIQTGSKSLLQAIPNTFVQSLDGIRFDDEGEFLFVASFGTNTITAYYSCDDWTNTIYVAGAFKGGCSDGANSAVTYTSNGDLIITCVNYFGSGPYTSTRITNIRSRLLGISYTSIKDFCSGEEPFQTDGSDNSNNNNNDDDEKWNSTIIILTVLTIFFGLLTFIFVTLYFIQRKASNDGSMAEMTKTNNILHP